MNINYNHLRIFCQVVESGGFSAAAKKLNLSQPTISRQVQTLEKQLGVALLRRNTAHLLLTSAGKKIFEYSNQQYASLDANMNHCLKITDQIVDHLRISIPLSLGQHFITANIHKFILRYPGIKLDLIYQNRSVDLIKDGLDLAISNSMPQAPDMKIKLLYKSNVSIYCTPEYIKRHGMPQQLSDLTKHRLFTGLDNLLQHIDTMELFNNQTNKEEIIRYDTRYRTNHIEQTKIMLYSHEILGIGLDFMFKSDVEEGKIIKLLSHYSSEPFKFYIVSHSNEDNPSVRLFIKFLEDIFCEN